MAKKTRRRRNTGGMKVTHLGHALDLMLSGINKVITPDFIMSRGDPFNADIGHLDPQALNTYDQAFVDKLISLKAKKPLTIPDDLAKRTQDYLKQRDALSNYHHQTEALIIKHDITAAKALGNFDKYFNKVVIRNDAELNTFYDYIALYLQVNNQRAVVDWRTHHPEAVTPDNQAVVDAFEQAHFTVLRLEAILEHGGIQVFDIVRQQHALLIDRALNLTLRRLAPNTTQVGDFFICSLLVMPDYVMTSGIGTPVSPTTAHGKSILTLFKKHLTKLRKAKDCNDDVMTCARDVIGFCLRSGALKFMTVGL